MILNTDLGEGNNQGTMEGTCFGAKGRERFGYLVNENFPFSYDMILTCSG